jgi:hypothetical protein
MHLHLLLLSLLDQPPSPMGSLTFDQLTALHVRHVCDPVLHAVKDVGGIHNGGATLL